MENISGKAKDRKENDRNEEKNMSILYKLKQF
jgi:hypothetical protein